MYLSKRWGEKWQEVGKDGSKDGLGEPGKMSGGVEVWMELGGCETRRRRAKSFWTCERAFLGNISWKRRLSHEKTKNMASFGIHLFLPKRERVVEGRSGFVKGMGLIETKSESLIFMVSSRQLSYGKQWPALRGLQV